MHSHQVMEQEDLRWVLSLPHCILNMQRVQATSHHHHPPFPTENQQTATAGKPAPPEPSPLHFSPILQSRCSPALAEAEFVPTHTHGSCSGSWLGAWRKGKRHLLTDAVASGVAGGGEGTKTHQKLRLSGRTRTSPPLERAVSPYFLTWQEEQDGHNDRQHQSLKCTSQRPAVSWVLPHNPSVPQMLPQKLYPFSTVI